MTREIITRRITKFEIECWGGRKNEEIRHRLTELGMDVRDMWPPMDASDVDGDLIYRGYVLEKKP